MKARGFHALSIQQRLLGGCSQFSFLLSYPLTWNFRSGVNDQLISLCKTCLVGKHDRKRQRSDRWWFPAFISKSSFLTRNTWIFNQYLWRACHEPGTVLSMLRLAEKTTKQLSPGMCPSVTVWQVVSWLGWILLRHPGFANVPPPLFQKAPDALVTKISI